MGPLGLYATQVADARLAGVEDHLIRQAPGEKQ